VCDVWKTYFIVLSRILNDAYDVNIQKIRAEQPLTLLVDDQTVQGKEAQKKLDELCQDKFLERTFCHGAIEHISWFEVLFTL